MSTVSLARHKLEDVFSRFQSILFFVCLISVYAIFQIQHLDVGCIAGLADALSGWGGKDGSVVVISHDREFCEKVGFTHVGTVMNGKLLLEQRSLRDSDWEQYDIGAANTQKLA